MGLGIEVVIVDWPRVEATAPGDREDLLIDATFGEVFETGDPHEHGWYWPTGPGEDWYGRYAFRHGMGSFTPHFLVGHRWDHLRGFIAPELRDPLDRFNDVLFWHALEDLTGEGAGLPERPCTWDAALLLWLPPDLAPVVAGWWQRVSPRLAELREPFDRHAAEPGSEVGGFERWTELLTDWGRVVTEAQRRGWGVVGLRC
ncbi:hypothetical protein ACH4E7_15065 [Kitasatospora sp. NPDC018058]|uniref:hypothetical protein n=1 Tax=Kitasatospora sp. NPDC018058 TaxID=3364025 RepID=UPI0037C16686